jgi:hypothetical protein
MKGTKKLVTKAVKQSKQAAEPEKKEAPARKYRGKMPPELKELPYRSKRWREIVWAVDKVVAEMKAEEAAARGAKAK